MYLFFFFFLSWTLLWQFNNVFLWALRNCTFNPMDQYLIITLQVLRMLPVQMLSGYPYSTEEMEPYPCRRPWEVEMPFAERARRRRSIYYPYYRNKNDVYNVFRVRYTTLLISEDFQCHVSLTVHYPSYTQSHNACFFSRKLESKSLPTLMWKHLSFVMRWRMRCTWKNVSNLILLRIWKCPFYLIVFTNYQFKQL